MAWALGTHRVDTLGVNGGTSGSINTTGMDFLGLGVATDSGVTLVAGDISDNKSNTWVLRDQYFSGAFERIHLFYVKNATVGTGHTITVTKTNCYASTAFASFSGSHLTAPADLETGAGVITQTTIQPGSLTPSEANCLVLTAVNTSVGSGTMSLSLLTLLDQIAGIGATAYGVALGYEIQTTATARNPTWTATSAVSMAAQIASFKAASVGGSTWGPLLGLGNNRLVQ